MQELDDKFVESEQNLGAARLRIKLLGTTLQVRGGEQNLGAVRQDQTTRHCTSGRRRGAESRGS